MSSIDELDESAKKGKFKVSPPTSPTSSSSFSSQQNGHYKNNITNINSPRHLSDTSDSGIDGHFKFLETYASPEYPDVFTITTNNLFDNKAYEHDTNSHRSKQSVSPQPSSRGSTLPNSRASNSPEDKYNFNEYDRRISENNTRKKTNSRKICVIVVGIILFLALAAVAIAVILVYVVFDKKDESHAQTTIRPEVLLLEGTLDLNETWSAELADRNSILYKSTARSFTLEINRLMENSLFNTSYIQTNVVQFSPGSIKVSFILQYNKSYKLIANSSEEFAQQVEDYIKYSAADSDSNIDARTVNIIVKPEAETTTATSTTSSTSPIPDNPPVSNAGPDIIITLPTNSALLNGSASTDDRGIVTYRWEAVSGLPVNMTASDRMVLRVDNLLEGTYVFRLTVTDVSGQHDSDSVTVTVQPAPDRPPVANAGPDVTITLPTNSTLLNGSSSTDDWGIVSYLWEKVSPTDVSVDMTGSNTSQLRLHNLWEGTYVFKLTVTDVVNQSHSDNVAVIVKPAPDRPPVANAGPDVTITLPTNSTLLNGSSSTDDLGIVSYLWEKVSPTDVSVNMTGSNTSQLRLDNLWEGTYVFKLTVTDVVNQSHSDHVNVIVKPEPDSPPVARAGDDVLVYLPLNSTVLNGSASTDDHGIVTYRWEKVSPTSLAVDMIGSNTSVAILKNLREGTYVFKLTVTDSKNQSNSDNVTVTVKLVPDDPPNANAGPDVIVNLPTNFTVLNGSASTDDTGIVTYLWEKISPAGLSVHMTGSNTSVLLLENLWEGTYVFKLTVTDKFGQQSSDSAVVRVESACLPVSFSVCTKRGFTQTIYPNVMGQMSGTEAEAAFKATAASVYNQICQEQALIYLCSLYFPKCDPQTGLSTFPCASLCQGAVNTCGNYFSNPLPCEHLLETDCFTMPLTTVAPTTAKPSGTCEMTQLQDCVNLGFNETKFPNFFYEPDQAGALETYTGYLQQEASSGCHADALFFLCSLQFPKCSAGELIKPCRRTCEAVTSNCSLLATFTACGAFSDVDCLSPPVPTPVCNVNEFTCGHVSTCVNESAVCNGINDCGDWSDEMDCVCKEFSFQCKMGMCIKSFKRCDGLTDCPDGSDEVDCKNCTKGQIRCPNGVCIMSEWLCDGRAECDDGWDEYNCDICGVDQFTCGDANNTCIDLTKRCDLVKDCPDGYDEWNCIRQDHDILQISYKKYWLPLCSNSWDDSYGDYICSTLLGEGVYINKTDVTYNVHAFAKISIDGAAVDVVQSVLGPITIENICPNNHVVRVNCNKRGCGKVLVESVSSFIVNGNDATPGAWPWQVALYMGGQFFCGGALISSNFVLTAAHCFEKYPTIDFLKVQLGTFNRGVQESTRKEVRAEALKIHEDHVWFKTNDIALIRLAEHVNFTNYIQPICLPEVDEPLPLRSECYAIGWGELTWSGGFAQVLQQLKMTLWDTEKCNSSIAWNGSVYGTSICAGYYSGVKTICKGDSGGPLVCRDKQNTWKAFGVASYVGNFCNMTERPNVYTNVSQLLDWISYNTACKFKCDNGKCLYETSFLCDRIDQCGDNSDEIRPCNRTVTCNFEDKYLCGYKYNGWELGYDNKLSARIEVDGQVFTQSFAPQFDHTVGRYPGRFFYGKQKEVTNAELWTPRFNTTGQTCIRFSYYQRGDISLGLSVYVYEYKRPGDDNNFTTTRPWTSGIGTAIDEWRTGYFDISLGDFRLKFQTGDLLKTAIDDVKLIPGMCSNVLCNTQTEYRCTGLEHRCIAKQSECNLAIDCDLGVDEKHCTNSTSSYICTFENGNLCALYQDVGDANDWWIVNASFIRDEIANRQFLDHTSSSVDVVANADLDMVGKDPHEPSLPYCVDCKGCQRTTFQVLPTFEDQWTRFQINLPMQSVVNVTYDVNGAAEDIGGFYRSFIILDDIYVKAGNCPRYDCPSNYTKCKSDDRCVPQSSVCDRKLDCTDESDEQQCVCTDSEYRCASGRCIPVLQFCDRIPQCFDGSDEGNVCAIFRTVSCDFNMPYMCGYSVEQFTKFHWQRLNGRTSTVFTGPENDNTFGNETGYYMYTEANEGGRGDNSSLLSPEFDTGEGRSVEFYYHLYSLIPDQAMPGILQLSFQNSSSGESVIQWQAAVNDLQDMWRWVCVNLPDNRTIRLRFTAIRNETTIYGVDMAIDDVKLRSSRCSVNTNSSVSTTPGPTTGPVTCRSDQFTCGVGSCIPLKYKCDGFRDCPGNGDDESGCPVGP